MTDRATGRVRVADLGGTEQKAVRRLLDLFRDHGWSDTSNAALDAVERLSRSSGGLSPRGLAAGLPEAFYLRNAVTRNQVCEALTHLVVPDQQALRR